MTLRETDFGFQWGPAQVVRTVHVEGRGRVITIYTGHRTLEVFVSEKGRSIRCHLDGRELTADE